MTARSRRYPALLATAAFALLSFFHSSASAQVPIGTAQSYGVLGASAVTNTGPSVINGDLGVSPGTSITGFPPGTVTGTTNVANAAALQAQNDATTAYNFLAGQACGTTITGDLGGRTLTPGVYCLASSAQLTGTLTLDAQGTAGAVFIFQIGSTLTTAAGSGVVLINGASACNVWWQVGSSATLGTTTSFNGTVIALASVTLNTGATLAGRAIARTGAVTLDTNTVSVPACAGPPPCPVITLAPLTLPSGTVGTAFAQTITASGTTALPATFSVIGGALPPGLVLGPTGTLTGTPTTAGTFTFTVAATDTASCSGNRTYVITIAAVVPPCPVITLAPLTLPSGTVGAAFAQTITTAGTTSLPATFSIIGGTLPPGLVLGPTGALTGIPTTGGTFTFTAAATDTAGCSGSLAYTVTIAAAVGPGPAAPVPTLSEWAMILLVALVAMVGFAGMRRRSR